MCLVKDISKHFSWKRNIWTYSLVSREMLIKTAKNCHFLQITCIHFMYSFVPVTCFAKKQRERKHVSRTFFFPNFMTKWLMLSLKVMFKDSWWLRVFRLEEHTPRSMQRFSKGSSDTNSFKRIHLYILSFYRYFQQSPWNDFAWRGHLTFPIQPPPALWEKGLPFTHPGFHDGRFPQALQVAKQGALDDFDAFMSSLIKLLR